MNKCLNCGNFIPDDAKVCPFCGIDLKRDINLNKQVSQQGYQFQQQQPYQQDLSYQHQPYQQQPYSQDPYFSQNIPYQQQSQQVPFQSQQGEPSFQHQPSVNYPQADNTPKILGISSIVLGVIACPANILAICGIFFSVLGLALGVIGFIKAVDNNDKIINVIGVLISFVMLAISCLNSIFGILLFMNI